MSFDQSTLSNTHTQKDNVDVYSLALILCRDHEAEHPLIIGCHASAN